MNKSARRPMTHWTRALAGIAAALALALPFAGYAQGYPSKPIRLIGGFPPGGGIDFTARLVGKEMAEGLGQPIIIENKSGFAGVLAASDVATQAPDGYTL